MFLFVFFITGIAFADIYVVAVVPGTAGEKAGLYPGDIIHSIDRQPVASLLEFAGIVLDLPDGIHTILIERAGVKRFVTVQILPVDFVAFLLDSIDAHEAKTEVNTAISVRRLGVSISSSMPGAAVTTVSSEANLALTEATRKVIHKPSDSLSERLAEINVLKYAFIDPNTGRVSFIGIYDPAYASGPIPYADLLVEALDHPYPEFSLDEGPAKPAVQAINQLFDKEMQHIYTDPEYGIKWMQNTLGTILQSKEPIPEKLVLDQHLKQLGIEPQGFAAYLDLKKSNADFTSEEQYQLVKNFMGKLFASIGIEERYGKALITMSMIGQMLKRGETNYELTMELSDLLGVSEEMQSIRSDLGSNLINNDTAARRLFGLFYGNLLKGMGVPASQVDAMVEPYLRGPRWDEELAAATDARAVTLAKEAFLRNILKSFVLTQAFLKRMYSLPTVYSGVMLYGMRADSPLTRVMFDADYALKYVTTLNPDTAALPGYLSTVEFLSAAAERLGRSDELKEGYVRYWVHPGEVRLEPFTDNSGVRFASATLRISVEPLDDASKKKAWLQQVLSEYANILNEQYDDYARLYPSLHVMRETEKVIALARWIKQNSLQVDVPKARPVVNPVPDRVEGFVSIIYVRKATGTTDDIFVCPSGGVVFGQDEGDGWIKTQPSVTTTRDVLQQLAASVALAEQASAAALSGNMESARDLAQHSADAMIGQIDTTQLTDLVPVPEPTSVDATVPVATRAAVSQEAIGALDRNLKGLAEARSQTGAVEGLRATSPEEYQRAVAAAKDLEKRSEDNLKRLQDLLTLYRTKPAQYPAVMVDLRSLDPSKPMVDGGPEKDAASVVRTTLHNEQDLQKIQAKIATLQLDAKIIRSRLAMFSRALLLNQGEYEKWAQTIDDSLEDASQRAKEFGKDLLYESAMGFLEKIVQKKNYALLDKIIFSTDSEERLWLGRELLSRHIHFDRVTALLEWNRINGDLAELMASDENNLKKYLDALLFVNDLFETTGLSKIALKGTLPGKWFYLTKMAGETAMDVVSIRWAWSETRKLKQEKEQIEIDVAWLSARMQLVEEEAQCLTRCLDAYTDACTNRCGGKSRYSTPPPPLK